VGFFCFFVCLGAFFCGFFFLFVFLLFFFFLYEYNLIKISEGKLFGLCEAGAKLVGLC